MARIPDVVSVFGIPYQVEHGGCEPDENGSCSPSLQVIRIREGLCPEQEQQVFLHELLHAILAGLAREDEYQDEHLVQGLAIGLHQALSSTTLGQGGKPAVKETYRIVFDGLNELAFKIDKIVGHLKAAQELLEELSGEHELTPRAVKESDSCGDADGATAFGADSSIRLHVDAHPA